MQNLSTYITCSFPKLRPPPSSPSSFSSSSSLETNIAFKQASQAVKQSASQPQQTASSLTGSQSLHIEGIATDMSLRADTFCERMSDCLDCPNISHASATAVTQKENMSDLLGSSIISRKQQGSGMH